MYLTRAALEVVEQRFGVPTSAEFEVSTSAEELAFIRRTQKRGRAHDVTLVIADGAGRFAAIAKHNYAPGAFRFPSGGVDPDEAVEAGAIREAKEETGLAVELTRYFLRSQVRFAARRAGAESIDWTSYVFEARVVGPDRLVPEDEHEIREAAWITRTELLGPIRAKLLLLPAAGIRYRVQLHEAIFAELDRRSESG